MSDVYILREFFMFRSILFGIMWTFLYQDNKICVVEKTLNSYIVHNNFSIILIL